ncbi:HIT domain-containing protein [Roseibium algae]|uniref:HIT domain-containing protein n=1 Tax=Roseibium algae TaxID=3123038 RepID=A0ABU8TRJ4_9HYPH
MKRYVFCETGAGWVRPDAKVYKNERVIAFFDRAPVTEYHTLVVTKRHARDIFDVKEEGLLAVTSAIRLICQVYREKLGIKDVQIVSSNGNDAQQDTYHLHFHIIPRAHGDG